jgi:uncharacterized protein YcbX
MGTSDGRKVGEELDAAQLGAGGIFGDRAYALVDRGNGQGCGR